jgi:hypothetical protein
MGRFDRRSFGGEEGEDRVRGQGGRVSGPVGLSIIC